MGKKTEIAKKINSSETTAQPAAKKIAAIKPVASTTAPATARKTAAAPKKTASKTTKPVLSVEGLQLRAYFISEKRKLAGLPADPHGDWVKAERELLSELKAKSSKKA